MTRASLTALACAALAAACAPALPPPLAAGAVAGACAGAAASLWSAARVRRTLLGRAERAMRALVEGFLLKLAVLVAGAVALRWVDALAAHADWRAYALAFGASAVTVLLVSVYELHAARAMPRKEPAA